MTNQHIHGLLFINKPQGLTSHDVVRKIRRIFSTKKVGHTGTLDPMATGMLPLVIGDATRFSNYLLSEKKSYTATVQLGSQTTTDDALGEILHQATVPLFTEDHIKQCLQSFTGRIEQVVPKYSAIHQDGQRLYKLARQGLDFTPPTRTVEVSDLKFVNYNPDSHTLNLEFIVSSGTYIRSLARDIGASLGVFGHLSMLHRQWIAPYNMQTCEALHADSTIASLAGAWVPMDDMLPNMSQLDLKPSQAIELCLGRTVPIERTDEDRIVVRIHGHLLGVCQISDHTLIIVRLRSNPLEWVNTLL